MNLQDLNRDIPGIEPVSPTDSQTQISDITCDSRAVMSGSLFVGVRGAKADGTAFIPDAVRKGAVAILIDKDAGPVASTCVVLRAADSREAMARLAARFHGLDSIQRNGGFPVVGVTGTNGKSTFGFMMRELLREAGRKPALFGTIEYDLVGRKIASSLTTPDAITLTKHLVEAHRSGADCAVMEVSSHGLELRRTDGIRFQTAVFTNLTQDHLDFHGTIDQYRLAKRRLFDNLDAEAFAVINAHDPSCDRMVENCRARVIRFGLDDRADVRGGIVSEDISGGRFVLEYRGKQVEIRTPMVGRHNIFNALAATAAGITMGLDLETIKLGLSKLKNVPGRLERVDTGELGFDVFVDYAHTDDALRNVLSSVRPLTRGRLSCLFGCGGDRDRIKRPLMARAVALGADHFVITSDNPRTEDPIAILADIERGLSASDKSRGVTIPDRAKAIAHAIERLDSGDTLIIAGKGHENYQDLGTHKIHFDDVETARSAVARRREKLTCAR
jgi:UDP-N-acetylmuramoyl-L-alanyl-D-glutamate--2,6-diaminopimelate ligase